MIKQYPQLAIYSYAQTLLFPVGSSWDKNECVCQTFSPAPPTCTHGPHEDRTHAISALHVQIPCSILCSILVPCRPDMSSSLSVICWQLQLRDSVDNMMCGEAGAVDHMSQDSRSLEMAPPQMDSLLDYGHKNSTLHHFRAKRHSLFGKLSTLWFTAGNWDSTLYKNKKFSATASKSWANDR